MTAWLRVAAATVTLFCAWSTTSPVAAQASTTKVLADDGQAGDLFGCALALDDNWLAVGSLRDDDGGTDAGSAYFYRRVAGGWVQEAKILAPDGAAGDQLGLAVALTGDGSRAVFGAPFHDAAGNDAGAAYVFERGPNGWAIGQKLLPVGAGNEAGAGFSVAATSAGGGRIALGAPSDTGGDGAVYVFELQGGSFVQTARITPPAPAMDIAFGWSVDLDGDHLAVGAPRADDRGSDSGTAFVYRRDSSGWVLEDRVVAPDGTAFDSLGWSVSLAGTRLLVGAPFDDPRGPSSGRLYFFERQGSSWNPDGSAIGAATAAGDQLGIWVELAGDLAYGGAREADPNGAASGAVDLFERSGTGWTSAGRLSAPDGTAGDQFGITVSASGGAVAVGAFLDDDRGSNSGSVYVISAETEADVSLTKTRTNPSPVAPGTRMTFVIEASNLGPGDAGLVRVSDPPRPRLLDPSWICSAAGGASCPEAGSGAIDELVDLPAGGSVRFELQVTLATNATGTVFNTATAEVTGSTVDPDPNNNIDVVGTIVRTDPPTSTADLAVSIQPPVGDLGVVGQPNGFRAFASNTGPAEVIGASVTIDFPPGSRWACHASGGARCSASGNGAIDDVVDLPAGAQAIYLLSVPIPPQARGVLVVTGNISPPSGANVPEDPDPANNVARATVLLQPFSDLSVEKLALTPSIRPGEPVGWEVVVANDGPSTSFGAMVSDPLPEGVGDAAWTCTPNDPGALCAASGTGAIEQQITLPPDSSVTFTYTATVSPNAAGTLVNTATVTSEPDAIDGEPGNNSSTVEQPIEPPPPAHDLRVSILGPTLVAAANPVAYTVRVVNGGPDPALGAPVSIDIVGLPGPPAWSCTPTTGASCTASGTGNVADPIDLPPLGFVTYTLEADAGAFGPITVNASVTAPGTSSDPIPSNNDRSFQTQVAPPDTILHIKSVDGDFSPGGIIVYTLEITNTTVDLLLDLPGNEFEDFLPPQLNLVDATANFGTIGFAGNDVFWNGELPAGETLVIEIEAEISIALMPGDLVENQAIFVADPGGNPQSIPSAPPSTPFLPDPTVFVVGSPGATTVDIPTLSPSALVVLALVLAGFAWRRLRRKESPT